MSTIGRLLPNVLPVIVLRELFEECQRVKESRTNEGARMGLHKPTNDLFSRKIFCLECGSNFVRHKITADNHTYICKDKRLKKGCSAGNISLRSLLEFMEDATILADDLSNHINFEEITKKIKSSTKHRKIVVEELEAQVSELIDYYQVILGKYTLEDDKGIADDLKDLMNKNKREVGELNERIDEMDIMTLERFGKEIKEKKLEIERLKKTKLHLIEDKMKFVERINLDNDLIRIEYSTPSYKEIFSRFNKLFKNTEFEANYYEVRNWTDEYIRNKQLAKELREQSEEWVGTDK